MTFASETLNPHETNPLSQALLHPEGPWLARCTRRHHLHTTREQALPSLLPHALTSLAPYISTRKTPHILSLRARRLHTGDTRNFSLVITEPSTIKHPPQTTFFLYNFHNLAFGIYSCNSYRSSPFF